MGVCREILPRDCATRLRHAERREQGFWPGSPLISQSIKLLSPDFFLPFPKTSGRGPSSCKILAALQAVLVLNLCLPPFCGYGLHHMRWHVKSTVVRDFKPPPGSGSKMGDFSSSAVEPYQNFSRFRLNLWEFSRIFLTLPPLLKLRQVHCPLSRKFSMVHHFSRETNCCRYRD